MMHQETFFYMYHQLDKQYKSRPSSVQIPDLLLGSDCPIAKSVVSIPAGKVRLGATEDEIDFGWDNEFPSHHVEVAAYGIDSTNVTIGEFLEFVTCGEYDNPKHWREEDFVWKNKTKLNYPVFWKKDPSSGKFSVILVFGDSVPVESVRATYKNASLLPQ